MDASNDNIIERKNNECIEFNGEVFTFKEIFWKIVIESIPSCIGMFITENVSNIKFIFVGISNNKNEIAALGIAETMITLFYYIPVISNMTTMDTFVSTNYGCKQYYQCGVYFNKTLLILTLLSIPLICILFFIKYILIAFGQDMIVADLAQEYFYYRIPTLVFFSYLEILKRYLYNLGYFKSTMIASAFEFIIEMILCYIFICYLKMNFIGTAIATGLTNIIVFLSVLCYFKCTSFHSLPQECFHIFNVDSIKNWREFFWYALPTIFNALIECGIFDVMQICAGVLGVIELGANSIAGKIIFVSYVTYFATSITTASFIGKSLGEGNYLNSKQAVMCGLLINLILIAFEIVAILFMSEHIFNIFTTDAKILESINTLKYTLCILLFFSSFQCFLKCVFRIIGWQCKITFINVISFCVLGNLAIYILTFTLQWKLYGIWTGYLCSLAVCTLTYFILHIRIDWRSECQNAYERINNEYNSN